MASQTCALHILVYVIHDVFMRIYASCLIDKGFFSFLWGTREEQLLGNCTTLNSSSKRLDWPRIELNKFFILDSL